MLSRKQFFKDLLVRGIRVVKDLAGEDETQPGERELPRDGYDLPVSEVSPSLLAIEAECRGLDPRGEGAEELRLKIYQELDQSRPPFNTPSPPLTNKSPLSPLCQRGVRGDFDEDLPEGHQPQPNIIAKGG